MKIIHVHNYYLQSGGEDQVFKNETRLLEEFGHEVFRYTRHNSELSNWSGIKMAINTIWNSEVYHTIDHLLTEIKPDICHIHNTFPLISPSVYYACKKHKIPVVQRLPNYRLICPGALLLRGGKICMDCLKRSLPWPGVINACYRGSVSQSFVVFMMLSFHRILRTWQKKVNIYVALNNYGCELFKMGGIPGKKIIVSPNFVDPDPEPEIYDKPGNYALFIGRLSKEKGLNTLLDAWKLLTDISLKIIGDGPLMRDLAERIELENIENVELLGRTSHDETMNILKKARVLLFPSEWLETFGLGIIEAFACGVPVIASRQKTIEEIIQHRENGLLFEPGNAHDLAQTVKEIWENTDLLQEMGKKARQSYLMKYSKQQKYNSLMEIYERAIEDNKK